jgi:prepilin-type N-terminal cleavage/methylation domain-containing protein
MRECRGFSLIELLVVVAIIAILASAGFAAYTHYINLAKDQAVLSDGQEIHRAIETDTIAAQIGVSTGGLAANLTAEDTCQTLVDKSVEKLAQQLKTNPFNGLFLIQTTVPTPAPGAFAELERGTVYISCAFPDAKLKDDNFYLQTCACTESSCPLTEVPVTAQQLDKSICYRL